MNLNWYQLSKFLETFKPQSLKGLAAEALKAPNFQDFEKDYLVQIKHGTYWHITDNPNFTIDPKNGPTDYSSIGTNKKSIGSLMVTTDLEHWVTEFSNRKYVAEIDMSQVERNDYTQVHRGFGNEFFIQNPQKAKVIRVIPLQQAIKLDKYRHSKIPQSQESLQEFYNRVTNEFNQFIEKTQIEKTQIENIETNSLSLPSL